MVDRDAGLLLPLVIFIKVIDILLKSKVRLLNRLDDHPFVP